MIDFLARFPSISLGFCHFGFHVEIGCTGISAQLHVLKVNIEI